MYIAIATNSHVAICISVHSYTLSSSYSYIAKLSILTMTKINVICRYAQAQSHSYIASYTNMAVSHGVAGIPYSYTCMHIWQQL